MLDFRFVSIGGLKYRSRVQLIGLFTAFKSANAANTPNSTMQFDGNARALGLAQSINRLTELRIRQHRLPKSALVVCCILHPLGKVEFRLSCCALFYVDQLMSHLHRIMSTQLLNKGQPQRLPCDVAHCVRLGDVCALIASFSHSHSPDSHFRLWYAPKIAW